GTRGRRGSRQLLREVVQHPIVVTSRNPAGLSENTQNLLQRAAGVEAEAMPGEEFGAALLAVDEDEDVFDDQSGRLEWCDSLQLGAAVGDDVVDEDDALAGAVLAFDE